METQLTCQNEDPREGLLQKHLSLRDVRSCMWRSGVKLARQEKSGMAYQRRPKM